MMDQHPLPKIHHAELYIFRVDIENWSHRGFRWKITLKKLQSLVLKRLIERNKKKMVFSGKWLFKLLLLFVHHSDQIFVAFILILLDEEINCLDPCTSTIDSIHKRAEYNTGCFDAIIKPFDLAPAQ